MAKTPSRTATKDEISQIRSAVQNGNLDGVRHLIGMGIRPDQGLEGERAVHLAADCGHAEIVQFLLDSGSNPNIKDAKGNTPLIRALTSRPKRESLHQGANESAMRLLMNNADANELSERKQHAFTLAAKRASYEVVETMARSGAIDSEQMDAALLMAAGRGDIRIVNLLIDAGARANSADSSGTTPLHVAAGQKNGCVHSIFSMLPQLCRVNPPERHGDH